MKISKNCQSLSNKLNNPEVLTNPEPFLGPNWETVLRFWLYFESLTDEQRVELNRRWLAIERATRFSARDLARDATIEVIGLNNTLEVCFVTPYPSITLELIAMHLLFERGHKLTFLPLIKDL